MHFDSINDVLIACVKASGGSKMVGASIWPDIAPDQAQRKLLNALDESRPENLSPSKVMFILRVAREHGYHDGVNFILESLSYGPTHPIEPRDEVADLQRQFIESQKAMAAMVAKMEAASERLAAQNKTVRLAA